MENEFPPNSHVKKEVRPVRTAEKVAPEKKEVARVTTGKVIQRKKPLHKKFVEAFRPEDGRGFVEYVLLEVFVNGVKDVVADASVSAIENALGVNSSHHRSTRRHGSGGRGYTSYSGMSSSRPRDRRDRDRDRDDDRRGSRRETHRRSSDLPELILDTRVEAEEVVDGLFELISKYEVASMRDLLSMVGEPHTPIDEDWGWTDLRGARVHRVREGYLLDLPRPEPLD